MRVRGVESEPPHRDTSAEHAVTTVHLGEKRCHRLIGRSGCRGGEAGAHSIAAHRAALEPDANRRGVVVILLDHLRGRGALERYRQLLEGLPADVRVVEAHSGTLEARIGETGLYLRWMADLSAGFLRGEGACSGELTRDQGVDGCTTRHTERVARGKYEPGSPRLEGRVRVVIVERDLRKKARAHVPRRSQLSVHSNREPERVTRSLEAR